METITIVGLALGGLFFIPAFGISVGLTLKWLYDHFKTKTESYDVPETEEGAG